MDKQEYSKLAVEDRVIYINSLLAAGRSLNAIGKDLGILESNIRQQFNKAGYKRVDKQFVLTNNADIQCTQNDNFEKAVEKPAQEEEPAPYAAHVNVNDFIALAARVEVLEQSLQEALEKSAKAIESRRIVIDLPEETQEVRNTFRLNGTVFQQWQELQKRCPGVTAKDLMSQALWEYINRHEVD